MNTPEKQWAFILVWAMVSYIVFVHTIWPLSMLRVVIASLALLSASVAFAVAGLMGDKYEDD